MVGALDGVGLVVGRERHDDHGALADLDPETFQVLRDVVRPQRVRVAQLLDGVLQHRSGSHDLGLSFDEVGEPLSRLAKDGRREGVGDLSACDGLELRRVGRPCEEKGRSAEDDDEERNEHAVLPYRPKQCWFE